MTRLWIAIASIGMSGCMSLASGSGPQVTRACSPEQAATLPEGARVELTKTWNEFGLVTERQYRTQRVGTVLKSSPEGVALINCTVEQRAGLGGINRQLNRIPYISRLFRNTGVAAFTVPVVWIPLDEIGDVRVVEPPPADYAPVDLTIETVSRPGPQFEAIGVDFDFATGEVSTSVVPVAPATEQPVVRRPAPPSQGESAGRQSLD
ncbi:hypothetical protein VT03_05560 [Planctomyces sp. SH-PL14]|nr:hypothetical protein VT03_05560 [Planctomyces sp. SH-PL14]